MSETVEETSSDSNESQEVVAGVTAEGVITAQQNPNETPEEAIIRAYEEMIANDSKEFLEEANATGQFIEGPYDTIPAQSLDVGDLFILPVSHPRNDSGQLVKVIGYTQPQKYGASVFAYGHFQTEEFRGLLTAKEDMEVDRLDPDHAEIDLN